jgi:hypothetical protein
VTERIFGSLRDSLHDAPSRLTAVAKSEAEAELLRVAVEQIHNETHALVVATTNRFSATENLTMV